jgi:large subunit ribosomal protein L31/Ran GTPase-activating protein 1
VHVQVVDLCGNQITRPGALAVVRGLAKAKAGGAGVPLELLALDENGISEAGVEQLKQLMKVHGNCTKFT